MQGLPSWIPVLLQYICSHGGSALPAPDQSRIAFLSVRVRKEEPALRRSGRAQGRCCSCMEGENRFLIWVFISYTEEDIGLAIKRARAGHALFEGIYYFIATPPALLSISSSLSCRRHPQIRSDKDSPLRWRASFPTDMP